MDFGKKILEKYGYKEGSGLGKNENGIAQALRTKFKFDQKGFGAGDLKEETNFWWERTFNEATNNINVKSNNESKDVQFDVHDKEGVEITNKSYSLKKLKKAGSGLKYGSFLKAATLDGKEEEIPNHIKTEDVEIKPIQVLTDEEILKACEYRTAHKGARHGLRLSGKLQRIAEQEKELLERMKQGKSANEIFKPQPAPSARKRQLLNSSKEEDSSDEDALPINLESNTCINKNQRRKQKQRLNVLACQIESIELDKSASSVCEEQKPPVHIDTPRRKSKQSKKKLKLAKISEEEEPKKEKKKKSKKRTLLDDDETMKETQPDTIESLNKARKRIKLIDSQELEAEEDDEDKVDKINESHHSEMYKRALQSFNPETSSVENSTKKQKKKKKGYKNESETSKSDINWTIQSQKKLEKYEKKKQKYKIKQRKLIEKEVRAENKSKKKRKKEVKKKLESVSNIFDSVEL